MTPCINCAKLSGYSRYNGAMRRNTSRTAGPGQDFLSVPTWHFRRARWKFWTLKQVQRRGHHSGGEEQNSAALGRA